MSTPGGLLVLFDQPDPQTASVTLVGDLEFRSVGALRPVYELLRVRSAKLLVVDLTKVDFCDSSGLSALVRLWRLADNRGARASLVGVTEHLAGLLRRVGVAQLFEPAEATTTPGNRDEVRPIGWASRRAQRGSQPGDLEDSAYHAVRVGDPISNATGVGVISPLNQDAQA